MASYRTAPDHEDPGWPRGIRYIVGNEGCERFSFYGMRAILFVYLSQLFMAGGVASGLAERQATDVYHAFNAAAYATPMLGALLADRLLGKYPTILWVSLFYCVGHAMLAIFEDNFTGFAAGLALIALGAGGIKPCVAAHVGDQFGRANFHRVPRVYQVFYFMINFGSFFATLLVPAIKQRFGFGWAFALPGVLMGIATAWFFRGRKVFVHVPPHPGGRLGFIDVASGFALFMVIALPMFGSSLLPAYAALSLWGKLLVSALFLALGLAVFRYRQRLSPDDSFLAVLLYCASVRFGRPESAPLPAVEARVVSGERTRIGPFWQPATRRFGQEAAEGPPAVLRIVTIFALVSVFWALFDQHSSSWIAQAREMDRRFTVFGLSFELLPEQIQAANPALVMLMVPLLGAVVFPAFEKHAKIQLTPLRRMTVGMFLTAASFVIVALLQQRLDAGERVHVSLQLIAYVVLTAAEVMVSATGLEFAYTQAPRPMKSLIMGFWYLAVSVGNLLVALLARFEDLPRVQFFWTFAGLMLGAATIFTVRAALYKYQTYTQ